MELKQGTLDYCKQSRNDGEGFELDTIVAGDPDFV